MLRIRRLGEPYMWQVGSQKMAAESRQDTSFPRELFDVSFASKELQAVLRQEGIFFDAGNLFLGNRLPR